MTYTKKQDCSVQLYKSVLCMDSSNFTSDAWFFVVTAIVLTVWMLTGVKHWDTPLPA